MRTKIKHNTKPSQICTSSINSPFYITELHLKLKLDFRKPFQVQSQLNTSPVNGMLVPQEAFKPNPVIPKIIPALCLNIPYVLNYVWYIIYNSLCLKQRNMGSPVLSKTQVCPRWLAFTYVGSETPGAIRVLTRPLI